MFQDTPQYMFNSDFVQCKLLVLFENNDSFISFTIELVDHELQIFLIVFSILTKQKM